MIILANHLFRTELIVMMLEIQIMNKLWFLQHNIYYQTLYSM